MKKGIVFLVLVGVLASCGTTSKTVVPTADSRALDTMIANKAFKIESDWANPLWTSSLNSIANSGLIPPGSSASRINLIGNSNYFKMEGDTVEAYLPYYGERHAGGGYASNTGIEFKGVPEDLELSRDDKSLAHKMSFDISKGSETFTITVLMYPNLTSRINVNSTRRLFISYDGKVSELEAKDAAKR